MASTCSASGVAGSSEPSLTDIMGVLMTIQNEQNTQLSFESDGLFSKVFFLASPYSPSLTS
jgi:hypothetical protein